MRTMGRSRGRARRRIDKAFSPGASRGFAGANMTAQPRTYGLAEAINAATNGGWGIGQMRDMMRDPRDDVAFGPSNPLAPAPIDPLRPDTGRPEPRLTEYPVAWNLPGNSDRLTPWSTLRAAAASVDIMRRCISIRKEQLQGLEWAIGLDDAAVQGIIAAGDGSQGRVDVEADLRRSLLPEIKRLTEFWCNPWKANGLSFEQWVNGIMEDHLVLDAVAIYPRMTYGGDVSAFELIDATTIKLLIDYRGARPTPPYPAFQQVLYGFPRGEFSSAARLETDEEGNVVELVEPGIPADQLWYFREEYRSFTPYGYSAVEQSLISARLYLKRQGWMLAEYDDGSTPLTWLVPDSSDGSMAEKLTFRTRRQWEDSLNDELSGQTRARHRMKVAPPGMNPVQMQGVDERYKPDYDMHLIKMLAGHFGVTSTGLGFSESKGLGNSGLHEGQADVQDASTTKPDTKMIERIVNELSRTYLKMPEELRFKFVSKDVEDQAAEDVARNAQRARGTITLNDDRKAIGKTPFTFPEADMPMVLVGNAWVPLEGMAERAEQAAEQEAALVESQLALTAQESAVEGEEVAEQDAEKALELSAYRRWARKRGGDARRPFICKALEPADWPGGDVPADVDFAEWEWVPEGYADDVTTEDLVKAFGGNDNWRTLARDHRGRWVKRGSMRIAPLGPDAPDKPVLAGLAQDASRRRRLAEIKTSQAAKRAAEEASRPRTDADLARRIAGSGIVISRRLKGMPAAAKLNPPSNAEGIRIGGIGPDGAVTDDMGREVGRLHPAVTAEQIEAGGWLRVETGVPGASGGFRTVSAWKDPSERQLPVSDASSTMDGMTTPKAPKRTFSVTLPDGTVATRESANPYTHAVVSRIDNHARAAELRREAERDAERGYVPRVGWQEWAERLESGPQFTHEASAFSGTQAGANAKARELNSQVNWRTSSVARVDGDKPTPPPVPSREERAAALNASAAAMMSGGPAPKGSMAERVMARQDQSVRDVVTSLQDAPGGWVAMADVRRKLEREHGMDRGQQDAALRRLATTGDRELNTAPEDNQKTLTDADHAAAVDFGAGPQHVISLDPPRAAVLDEAEAIRRADAAGQEWDDAKERVNTFADEAHMAGTDEGEEFEREYAALQAAERAASRRYDDAERVVSDVQRPRLAAESKAKSDAMFASIEASQAPAKRRAALMEETKYHPATMDRGKVTPDVVADFVAKRSEGLDSTKYGLSYDQMALAGVHGDDIHAAVEAGAVKRRTNQAGQVRYFAATPAERERHAEVQRIQAETRAELLRRTPEAYAKLLGGERNLTHAPSRKLLESMREQGFVVTRNMGGTSTWEAPDGRKLDITLQAGGKVGTGGRSMKDAHAYVGVQSGARAPKSAADTTPTASAARAEAVAASTPDAPSAAPAGDPQKAAYDKLLDGGMVKHRQARQIVEQMEAHGWKLTDQNPMVSVTQWEAPDGRKMAVQFLTSDKPKFYPGGQVLGGNPSFKAALAHVVTPTHAEVGGPNVRAAAERVSAELGQRVRAALSSGGNDDHVRRLDRAQRELVGYGSTPKRPVADVVAGLRSDADRLDATAQSNAEHHERIGGFGESPTAARQRREAGELRAIADVMDQQATERAAYEAERERRAAAPLDIRPTSRGAAKRR